MGKCGERERRVGEAWSIVEREWSANSALFIQLIFLEMGVRLYPMSPLGSAKSKEYESIIYFARRMCCDLPQFQCRRIEENYDPGLGSDEEIDNSHSRA